MTGGVKLRPATVADAKAIAGIAVRTWQHAYADLVDPRSLAERTVNDQLRRWRRRLAVAPGDTVVASAGSRVAGYATVGPCSDADAAPETGSILALYVDPPAQGAGLGTRLLEDAVARLRAAGYREATLWALEAYGLARSFYEGRGWSLDADGAGNEDPAWRDPGVRYRREL